MDSLQRQLSLLGQRLEKLQKSIPVDAETAGLTVEQHSPGNGSTYTRLRAPKGKKLPNGNRTMGLNEAQAAEWQAKIYARNQQAKVAQCLALVQQAADIANDITWKLDSKPDALVNRDKKDTKKKEQVKGANKPKLKPTEKAPSKLEKSKAPIRYVLKDGGGATTLNRKVHAIAQEQPGYGRWYTPALCGDFPKPNSMGWRTCDASELSCPKCYGKLQQMGRL